ncbi:MAG: ankyrin repeat domain-containing protein [Verrucomicrobiia bacterium]
MASLGTSKAKKTISRTLLLLAMAWAVVVAGERRPKEFTTEIHKAVEAGDLEKVKRLLDARPEWVKEVDGWAHTPLHVAALPSQPKVAELLLRYKPDVNAKTILGMTPLHWAAQSRWGNPKEMVKLLLSNGADVNAKDDSGETPLHEVGTKEVAEILLAHGANVNARDNSGSTPLHEAKSRAVAETLLAHGADVNAVSHYGDTPLHKAWNGGVAKVLLRYKAKLEAKDEAGRTPLHSAGSFREMDVSRVLLAAGANPDAQDKDGFAPLHYAAQRSVNLVRLLLVYKADINIKAKNGYTPLQLAMGWPKNKQIVEILLARKAVVTPANEAGQEKTEAPVLRVTNAADYARVYTEPQLTDLGRKGKWDETNLVSHVSAWLVKEPFDLTGEWAKNVHDDAVALKLKKRNDGKYDIEYHAGGDLAGWTLRRTGSYDGGVLTLDRPVQGYIPRPASMFFYLLRTPIGVRLTEQHAVRYWIIEKKYMQWPQIVWDQLKEDGRDKQMFLKKKEPQRYEAPKPDAKGMESKRSAVSGQWSES